VVTTRSASYTPVGTTPPTVPGAPPTAPPGLPGPDRILGRAAGENFRVASRVLSRDTRSHLMAVYGFARLVDYLGDEYEGDRVDALDWLTGQTEQALTDPDAGHLNPLVADAARTVRGLNADPDNLRNLIAANRQDQVVRGYATFDDLVGYCRLSADPIGRLVLSAFAAADPDRFDRSDRICTGLQLAEHWQDVAEDAAANRIYLPADDMARFGVHARDLTAGPPASAALRGLMAFQVARARRLLDEGTPLIRSLSGRARWAVAGFWAGGQAALDAIADGGFDPLRGTPRPAPRRVASHLAAALRGPRAGREAS
jgi:squalene synthase HpnC